MRVYVGMDVHRKRSQVAVVDNTGVLQRNRNVANDPAKLVPILGALPPGTQWRSRPPTAGLAGRAAGGTGAGTAPGHPSRGKAIASARLKNDKVDAATLAQLLRADLLPQAWIAPRRPGAAGAAAPPGQPGRPGTSLKHRVHAVLADCGIGERSSL